MGYIRHHAIIVTSVFENYLKEAHLSAIRIFENRQVSPIVYGIMNGYDSFFVAPDGSKEGWEESEIGDIKRDAFLKKLDSMRCEDGGSYVDWVEVQYGDDNRETKIIRHSDERG